MGVFDIPAEVKVRGHIKEVRSSETAASQGWRFVMKNKAGSKLNLEVEVTGQCQGSVKYV